MIPAELGWEHFLFVSAFGIVFTSILFYGVHLIRERQPDKGLPVCALGIAGLFATGVLGFPLSIELL